MKVGRIYFRGNLQTPELGIPLGGGVTDVFILLFIFFCIFQSFTQRRC